MKSKTCPRASYLLLKGLGECFKSKDPRISIENYNCDDCLISNDQSGTKHVKKSSKGFLINPSTSLEFYEKVQSTIID